jgi:dCMP deaminase
VSSFETDDFRKAMAIAKCAAENSHDDQTQVGAVLVKKSSGSVVAVSYNGFVRGAPDDKLPKNRPDKYKFMMHAEMNLILNCARHGIAMEDCMVVCTHTPCEQCSRLMWQSGIDTVVASEAYGDPNRDLPDIDIQVGLTTGKDNYYHLQFSKKKKDE